MDSQAKEAVLVIDTHLCTGCRACELACSFCLKGYYDPAISRIKITRDNEKGKILCQFPRSCPECSYQVEPPCVESCGPRALTLRK